MKTFVASQGAALVACVVAGLACRAQAQTNLAPFPWDWSQAGQSMLNLSRFLDAPAGKGGFVRGSGESTPYLAADVTNDFCVLPPLPGMWWS